MNLQKLADRAISIFGLVLFGTLTGFSLFFTVYYLITYEEIPYEKGDIFLLVLAVCTLGLFCMEWIAGWILKDEDRQEKRIHMLLSLVLLYTLCFCILWVKGAGCIPVADQASVCRAAEGFQNGDYSMLTRDSYEKYLYIHPHQLGLTALIELIFAFFGNGNFQAFEYLNCLGAVLCIYSGYRITRLLARNMRGSVYYLFLAAGCFPLFFYVTFVYGEIPSLTYSLIAVWMYLEHGKAEKRKRYLYLGGCCAACALACLIRNNSLIFLIAFSGIWIVEGIGRKQWKPFVATGILIAVFLISRQGLRSFYEERAGIQLNEGAPMILYVAMGMQEGPCAPGWTNGYILHAYWGESEFDGELAVDMALRDIRASVSGFRSDPLYAVKFYREKFTSQWNDPTYQCFGMTYVNGWERCGIVNSMYVGKLHTLMTWFMNQYQSLVFIGAFLCVIFNFWRKKPLEDQVLLLTILGGFLFHMLWEAKGRYILPYFVMMLPMTAIGLAELMERMKSVILKNKLANKV